MRKVIPFPAVKAETIDFADYPIGAEPPPNWSYTWRFGQIWTVAEHPEATGGRLIETLRVDTVDKMALLYEPAGDNVSDVDLRVRVAFDAVGLGSRVGLVLRVAGEAGYYLHAKVFSGELVLNGYDSVNNPVILATLGVPLAIDMWYQMRFQAIGTRLRGKIWAEGEAEPGWMIDVDDDTAQSGALGFGGTNGSGLFDVLEIAVPGQRQVIPFGSRSLVS